MNVKRLKAEQVHQMMEVPIRGNKELKGLVEQLACIMSSEMTHMSKKPITARDEKDLQELHQMLNRESTTSTEVVILEPIAVPVTTMRFLKQTEKQRREICVAFFENVWNKEQAEAEANEDLALVPLPVNLEEEEEEEVVEEVAPRRPTSGKGKGYPSVNLVDSGEEEEEGEEEQEEDLTRKPTSGKQPLLPVNLQEEVRAKGAEEYSRENCLAYEELKQASSSSPSPTAAEIEASRVRVGELEAKLRRTQAALDSALNPGKQMYLEKVAVHMITQCRTLEHAISLCGDKRELQCILKDLLAEKHKFLVEWQNEGILGCQYKPLLL